jgi:outer membrane protein assembly factor BamB
MTRRIVQRGLLVSCAVAIVACGGQADARNSSTASAAATGGGDALSAAVGSLPASSAVDWPLFDDSSQRAGDGPASTGITATNLSSLALRRVRVNGIVDSSAIELHDVVVGGQAQDAIFVTTSYGKTIAINPDTGRQLWEFNPPGVDSSPGNPQVTTATPAADPDRQFIYSASPNGVIHKLSVADGTQVWSTRVTFDPGHEKIASALNISGAWVVVTTGGYIGDIPPYDGHVVTISRSTGRIVHVWNSECSHRHRLIRAASCGATNTQGDNAIWGRSGAVIEPGSGRILVATGNGPFNGTSNWGDSVLELSPDASRLLHNWTPANQAQLDAGDVDVGSTSPVVLPSFGRWHLIIQSGKDGRLHLLNLRRLDGTTHGASRRLGGELSETSAPGGGQVLTAPAVWESHHAIYVFVASGGGTAAYRLVDPRHPRLRTVWEDGTGGTSPVLAGGLLYVYDPGGSIDVRRPLSEHVLASLSAPSGHWNSPIVIDGQIIEPTGAYGTSATSSEIDIYHLPGH